MSINQVFQAQSVFQAALLAKPNVVGVAIGNKNQSGEPSVVVLVSHDLHPAIGDPRSWWAVDRWEACTRQGRRTRW